MVEIKRAATQKFFLLAWTRLQPYGGEQWIESLERT